jgi:hypothetical protein
VRAIDGLVAAIGCAAFPNMFHLAADNDELTDAGVNNILRAVRGAYKKSERHMANSKARSGKVSGKFSTKPVRLNATDATNEKVKNLPQR